MRSNNRIQHIVTLGEGKLRAWVGKVSYCNHFVPLQFAWNINDWPQQSGMAESARGNLQFLYRVWIEYYRDMIVTLINMVIRITIERMRRMWNLWACRGWRYLLYPTAMISKSNERTTHHFGWLLYCSIQYIILIIVGNWWVIGRFEPHETRAEDKPISNMSRTCLRRFLSTSNDKTYCMLGPYKILRKEGIYLYVTVLPTGSRVYIDLGLRNYWRKQSRWYVHVSILISLLDV